MNFEKKEQTHRAQRLKEASDAVIHMMSLLLEKKAWDSRSQSWSMRESLGALQKQGMLFKSQLLRRVEEAEPRSSRAAWGTQQSPL